MQKFWKSFFLSIVCVGWIIQPAAVNVNAAATSIEVHYNTIHIQVDDAAFEGNHFVYEGTIYLPLRRLAEALGYPVHFYNETKTAYIGELPEDELPEELVKQWKALEKPPKREPETIMPVERKKINVRMNPITVKANGRIVESDNLLHHSVTYVPMRAIAEMLDIPVMFYEPNKTAFFGYIPTVLTDDDWISVLNLSRNYHIFYLSHDPDKELYVFYDHVNQRDIEYIHVPDSILESTEQEWIAGHIRMKRLGDTLFFYRDDLISKGIIPVE